MALKALHKRHVVQTKQTKSVINERNALEELRGHCGIVKLYGSFQNRDCLYFALEIVPGGELWSALYNVPSPLPKGDAGGISSKAAMFYGGCVTSALDHIHSRGALEAGHARQPVLERAASPSHLHPSGCRAAQGMRTGT